MTRPARAVFTLRLSPAGIAAIKDAAAAAGVPVSDWHRAALSAALAKPHTIRPYLPTRDNAQ